jgi:uncharacterized radical SAM superfamily Fe-S cluster-containing enzyme
MNKISTKSSCNTCRQPIPAEIFDRNGDLYIRKQCETHGEQEALFWKNSKLYRKAHALRHPDLLPEGPLDPMGRLESEFVTTLAVDVTTRCNLDCPTCVTSAGVNETSDPSTSEVLSWIPDYSQVKPSRRPNISLIGGESALRDDLPELIRGIIAKGLVPRLNSNGLLLTDEKRLDRLWEAGLRWVILQFDGFDADPSIVFRGHDLSKQKFEAIDALSRKGFAIHLAVMIQKGVNDNQLGRILEFAVEQPRILRASFYPRSWIGRFGDGESSTHVHDVLSAIEETTGGQVSVEDILDAKRLGRKMFALTKKPMFRQRVCIYPFVLMTHKGRLIPASRLFGLKGWTQTPGAGLKLLTNATRLMNPDRQFGAGFLLANVEKFYDEDAFDHTEARNCHHLYLSAKGAYPFCIYNTLVRRSNVAADE